MRFIGTSTSAQTTHLWQKVVSLISANPHLQSPQIISQLSQTMLRHHPQRTLQRHMSTITTTTAPSTSRLPLSQPLQQQSILTQSERTFADKRPDGFHQHNPFVLDMEAPTHSFVGRQGGKVNTYRKLGDTAPLEVSAQLPLSQQQVSSQQAEKIAEKVKIEPFKPPQPKPIEPVKSVLQPPKPTQTPTSPPKSITPKSAPVVEAPKPVVEAPKIEPIKPTPKPVTEAPKPVTEAPKPVAEAPKVEPIKPTPKPVTEAPKPVAEAPKVEPIKPTPKPITEAPKPVAEAPKVEPIKLTPKPVAEAPKVEPKVEPEVEPKVEPIKQAPAVTAKDFKSTAPPTQTPPPPQLAKPTSSSSSSSPPPPSTPSTKHPSLPTPTPKQPILPKPKGKKLPIPKVRTIFTLGFILWLSALLTDDFNTETISRLQTGDKEFLVKQFAKAYNRGTIHIRRLMDETWNRLSEPTTEPTTEPKKSKRAELAADTTLIIPSDNNEPPHAADGDIIPMTPDSVPVANTEEEIDHLLRVKSFVETGIAHSSIALSHITNAFESLGEKVQEWKAEYEKKQIEKTQAEKIRLDTENNRIRLENEQRAQAEKQRHEQLLLDREQRNQERLQREEAQNKADEDAHRLFLQQSAVVETETQHRQSTLDNTFNQLDHQQIDQDRQTNALDLISEERAKDTQRQIAVLDLLQDEHKRDFETNITRQENVLTFLNNEHIKEYQNDPSVAQNEEAMRFEAQQHKQEQNITENNLPNADEILQELNHDALLEQIALDREIREKQVQEEYIQFLADQRARQEELAKDLNIDIDLTPPILLEVSSEQQQAQQQEQQQEEPQLDQLSHQPQDNQEQLLQRPQQPQQPQDSQEQDEPHQEQQEQQEPHQEEVHLHFVIEEVPQEEFLLIVTSEETDPQIVIDLVLEEQTPPILVLIVDEEIKVPIQPAIEYEFVPLPTMPEPSVEKLSTKMLKTVENNDHLQKENFLPDIGDESSSLYSKRSLEDPNVHLIEPQPVDPLEVARQLAAEEEIERLRLELESKEEADRIWREQNKPRVVNGIIIDVEPERRDWMPTVELQQRVEAVEQFALPADLEAQLHRITSLITSFDARLEWTEAHEIASKQSQDILNQAETEMKTLSQTLHDKLTTYQIQREELLDDLHSKLSKYELGSERLVNVLEHNDYYFFQECRELIVSYTQSALNAAVASTRIANEKQAIDYAQRLEKEVQHVHDIISKSFELRANHAMDQLRKDLESQHNLDVFQLTLQHAKDVDMLQEQYSTVLDTMVGKVETLATAITSQQRHTEQIEQVQRITLALFEAEQLLQRGDSLQVPIKDLQQIAQFDQALDNIISTIPTEIIQKGVAPIYHIQRQFASIEGQAHRAVYVPPQATTLARAASFMFGFFTSKSHSLSEVPQLEQNDEKNYPTSISEDVVNDSFFRYLHADQQRIRRAGYFFDRGNLQSALEELKVIKNPNVQAAVQPVVLKVRDRLAMDQTLQVLKAHSSALNKDIEKAQL